MAAWVPFVQKGTVGVATTNRDRKKPRGPSLPHHRAYGSRTRRFGRLSQHAPTHWAELTHWICACQPEHHLWPRQPRVHPSQQAHAHRTRRVPSHRSLASDFSSLSIPSRGTVRAFGKPLVAQRLGFPTTPSADFCPAVKAGLPILQSLPLTALATEGRSPVVRHESFLA